MSHRVRLTGLTLLFLITEISLILFIDKPLSQYLRAVDAAHPALIDFFRAYTDLGKGLWYAVLSVSGGLVCAALYYRGNLTSARRATVLWLGQVFGFTLVAINGAGLVADLLKIIVGRARPKLLKMQDFYGFDPFNIASADWRSFPSGHSTTVFAAACALGLMFPRLRWPLLALAVAVGLSRVMINAHYLGDVVAGAALGWGVAWLVAQAFSRRGWVFRIRTLQLADAGKSLRHNPQ